MDKKYQIAYSEALLIINNSEQEIKNKIPKSFIKFLEDNKDSEYTPNFNFDEDDWFEKLTPETKAVVALIIRDYVATPEDKEAFIKDQNDKIITAFKTSRNIGNLLYSSKDLDYESYKIYTGGTIDGEETNGLYTKINSYTDGEEITFNDVSANMKLIQNKDISNTVLIILIAEIVLLAISLTIYIKRNHKEQLD